MKTKFSFSKKPRTSLLLATFTLLLLSAQSTTFAGSATWDSSSSTDWNTDGNWMITSGSGYPGTPPGTTDTATFDNLSSTTSLFISSSINIAAITFTASETHAFTITVNPGFFLIINGFGITNGTMPPITQNFVTASGLGPSAAIAFTNSATAGSMTAFTNNGGTVSSANGGLTEFNMTSTAGSATITNNGGTASSAGGGNTDFFNTSTAGSATITNNAATVSGADSGVTGFAETSTAGSATITNNGGTVSSGEAGITDFHNRSSASTATITNNGGTASGGFGGVTEFFGTDATHFSTADHATITNNGATASGGFGGGVVFNNSSTAGSATITNNGDTISGTGSPSVTQFMDSSTAGTAMITNKGGTVSGATGGRTFFEGTSTAGSATLIAKGGTAIGADGGSIQFLDVSTGGTASVDVRNDGAGAAGNLDISGHGGGVTIGSLEGSGNVFLGANILAVGSNNLSKSFSGVIQDGGIGGGTGGSLIKIGTGTFTLTGANTYTGATTVNAGTLLVNGSTSSSSAVTVINSGSTLGGTGTIGGSVTIGQGANLSPGTSPGILNTGSVTLNALNSGSNLLIDINGPTVGSQYDQLNVTGTVTLTGSNLVVTVGGTISVNQTFTIINNDLSDAVVGMFAQGSSVTSGGDTFSINYAGGDGNDVVLTATIVAVPEPSTWVAGALMVAFVAYTQRRRFAQMSRRA